MWMAVVRFLMVVMSRFIEASAVKISGAFAKYAR